MSLTTRVIPLLHVKDQTLVKGVQMEGLRVLGDPGAFARHYYQEGADELIFIDIVASLYGRNTLLPVVEQTARDVFVPLTVGGGIRSCDDIRACLNAGADKVAINTAAVKLPEFLAEAAERFGSQCVVVSLEVIRRPWGYEVLVDNAREPTGLDAIRWAERAVTLGAGEVLLNSVDRDGTGRGYDLDLIRSVSEAVSVPVIAAGGGGHPQHCVEAVQAGADAVAIGSMLHYKALEAVGASVGEGNTEFLEGKRGLPPMAGATISDVKEALCQGGVSVRGVSRV